MNARETMLKCTELNRDYMRLPVGKLDGYTEIPRLYKRIAAQSFECAQAWVKDKPCPEHEPAVDAFWWTSTSWLGALGISWGINQAEWQTVIVAPHRAFAWYLKPNAGEERIPPATGTAAEIIMKLDLLWLEHIVDLTMRWGLTAHLKDKGALDEAHRLRADLCNPASPAYIAYLDSDLGFFHKFFPVFSLTFEAQEKIAEILAMAER